MKILCEKYPKGTFKSQKSDGRYIDGFLYQNLELLARRIVDDMTFMAICFSSTLEVGTGKSVFCTQMGEAWTEIMNRIHGLNLTFTQKNIVFRPKELIERAFQVPQYSFLLVDEWEDATYWSELGMSLRTFFRKCRQLNLFIMVIIPNFFQLPISYAVSRSVFAIDVKFEDDFARGFFDFYSFKAKRILYIKGKKEHNYFVVRKSFSGRFLDGYGIPEKEYRAAKRADMLTYEQDDEVPQTKTEIKHDLILEMVSNSKGKLTQKQIAQAVNLSEAEVSLIVNGKRGKKRTVEGLPLPINTYNNNHSKDIDYSKEEEVESQEELKKNE